MFVLMLDAVVEAGRGVGGLLGGMKPSDPDGAAYGSIHKHHKYNDGFKGQHRTFSQSMTDFLYDFITLHSSLPQFTPNDRTAE